ncbi:MAG: unnamed protein product [uncultured Paraburkholderia sp.]|nr:MAG: unnamed protein product [uncultured Paraburkholderia sp.]CAH2944365.1 MAG: unnamed protein product [uncultured Paraburkholderia sp.]
MFLILRENVLIEDYEATRPLAIELDGTKYAGTFRVMSSTVLVYYKDQIKYPQYGLDRPEVVARWLITDLCCKIESKNCPKSSPGFKT